MEDCLEKRFGGKKVYSVRCTLNSAPQFVEEALVFLGLGSYLGSYYPVVGTTSTKNATTLEALS